MKHCIPRLLVGLLVLLVPGLLFAQQASLWQQGIALSAERILTGDYDELYIEQTVTVNSNVSQLWNILTDLRQYPQFLSFTQSVDIHNEYNEGNHLTSEFTAYQRRPAGHFIIENIFFGVLQAKADQQRINLLVWQLDGVFIELDIQLTATSAGQTQLAIQTHLTGDKASMLSIGYRELSSPFFHTDHLRALLEEGISIYTDCMSTVTQRYCF